jgi:hypothetical protein
MFSTTPSLPSIPLELRLEIFKYVLPTPSYDDDSLFYPPLILGTRADNDNCLTYRDGLIGPIPAVVSLCQQLRAEILPLFFQSKTVWFYTFGELGTALQFAPSTVPYWKKVHVDWTGRRPLTAEGQRWQLEPGLEMLKKIPKLLHLSLDTDIIQRQLGTDVKTEIARITNEICRAMPEHPTLRTIRITGCIAGIPVVRNYGRKFVTGGFRRMFERRRSGTWACRESFTDGVTCALDSVQRE